MNHTYYYDQPGPLRSGRAPAPALRPTRRRPAVAFLAFLLLILGGTALAACLGSRLPPVEPDLWGGEGPTLDMQGNASSAQVLLERAPTGDGTTLTIQPAGEGGLLSYQEIYQKNSPAIVSITCTGEKMVSQGTGVVLSQDGYIITNAHVIEGARQATVALEDGRSYDALLVGQDTDSDLAVLKIEAQGLTPAEFGDSDALTVGDPAIAIGNPLGEQFRGTMTDGIISAINRDVYVDGRTMVLLQTNAALNSGNSGGALINIYGQVVGITTLKMMSYGDTIEGLGFAIPTSSAKVIVDGLIEQGRITGRPTIGITVLPLTKEQAAGYGLTHGLQIQALEEKSDACKKGLQLGDIVLSANGRATVVSDDLLEVRDQVGVGGTLELQVWRSGAYHTFQVQVMERYEMD
jgi:serine protease Do